MKRMSLRKVLVFSLLITYLLGTFTFDGREISIVQASGTTFLLPSSGYVGFLYTDIHNGIDIWSSYPNSAPCGNPVRSVFKGTVYKIKKTISYTDAPTKGDAQASIVVLKHTGVPGLPDPFYTWYLHMAKDDGTGTCISNTIWDKLGQEVPAGFPLGNQGNMRLAGDVITHLHFMITNDGNDDNVTYDPSPFLGLNICQNRTNCNSQPGAANIQKGNGLLYAGQTIRMSLNTVGQQDSIYFYSNQGQPASIHMNKLDAGLNSALILYAPDGSEVTHDDDGGGDTNAWINQGALPQTGYYRVVAASSNGGSAGRYSLSLDLRQGISVALIVDSSGSMSWNDPQDLRKWAAKYFVDLAQVGDKAAVVDFDDALHTWKPLTAIQSPADRNGIKAAVDNIDSNGGTNLGVGLQEGYNQLASDLSTNKKAAIFLTDGRGAYNNEALAYVQNGWPIYVIGLGSDIDPNLLQIIATSTGGKFYPAPTNTTLLDIYQKLSHQLQNQTTVDTKTFLAFQNQTQTFNINIPAGASQVTFSTSWPGSDVGICLVTPSGIAIDANTTLPGLYHAKEATYEIFRLDNPESGSWNVDVQGIDLRPEGEMVTLNINASGLGYRQYIPLVRSSLHASSSVQQNSHVRAAAARCNSAPIVPPTFTPTPTDTPTPTTTPVPGAPTNTPTATPTPTPTNTPVPSIGCVTSAGAWQNNAITPQIGMFTAAFDATPNAASMDGVIGLAADSAADYAQLAAIARFSPTGVIDARNGAAYQAASQIPYTPGVSYHFRMEVDIPNHVYSVFVTPAGGAEQLVGDTFAFRTEQGAVGSLNTLALYAKSGSHQVCNVAITTHTSPPPSTCATSSSSWQNTAITAQSGSFTAAFDATPNNAPMDGVMGLSASPAADYATMASIARFSPTGMIDARNGGAYLADTQIPYTAGVTYHFRLVIRIPSHTYDIFVTPAGGTELVVGNNFAFRTEQSSVGSLGNWALYAKTGNHTVCNLAISP